MNIKYQELEIMQMYKEKYTYNKENGDLIGPGGIIIKRKTNNGYIRCNLRISRIKKIDVLAHRLAWFLETGEIPDVIDHINGIKTDNRFCNLRNTTQQKNLWNRNDIVKGYCWNKQAKKWQVSIKINKKSKYLGLYNTEEEAHQVYLDAKKIYHII